MLRDAYSVFVHAVYDINYSICVGVIASPIRPVRKKKTVKSASWPYTYLPLTNTISDWRLECSTSAGSVISLTPTKEFVSFGLMLEANQPASLLFHLLIIWLFKSTESKNNNTTVTINNKNKICLPNACLPWKNNNK